MNTTKLRLIVAVSWLLLSVIHIAAADQPSPLPNTSVHDFAGVISDDWKAQIQSKSQRLKDEYKTEIALVTINSLEGEDVFDYSMRMARAWGIGSKDNDIRGLLILVAVQDRKTAFRTSRHIEGEIPDAVTAEISKEMNAFFKRGDFGGGLSAGMDKILERMQEVYESPTRQNNSSSTGLGWLWALIFGLPVALAGSIGLLIWKSLKRQERRLAEQEAARRRAEYFSSTKRASTARTSSKQKKGKTAKSGKRKSGSKPSSSYRPSYDSSSSISSSSYDSGSSSSYDSGSSSSYDSGSSYSGGSDFGGGGSDSSW